MYIRKNFDTKVYIDNVILESMSSKNSNVNKGKEKSDKTNLSLLKGVSISTNRQFMRFDGDPKFAIDGDFKTYWLSAGVKGSELIITLPEIKMIGSTYWTCEPTSSSGEEKKGYYDRGLKDYEIWVSEDGIIWKVVKEVKDFIGGGKKDDFNPVLAKMVKLSIQKTQGNWPAVICEFEIYPAEETKIVSKKTVNKIHNLEEIKLDISTDKLLYRFEEKTNATIYLLNDSDSSVQGDLIVSLRHGVENPSIILNKSINLCEKSKIVVPFVIEKKIKEYGYCLKAEFRFENYKLSKDVVFEVYNDWKKMARLILLYAGHDYYIPDFTEKDLLERWLPIIKYGNFNVVQMNGNITPGGTFSASSCIWKSPHGTYLSIAKQRMWREELSKLGLKFIQYWLGYSFDENAIGKKLWIYGPLKYKYPKDKDRFLYTIPLYWKEMSPSSVENFEKCFPAGEPVRFNKGVVGGGYAWNLLDMADFFADDLYRGLFQFDYDGYFFDEILWPIEATATGHDASGRKITNMSPDEVGYRFFQTLKKKVLPFKPDFTIIGNCGIAGQCPDWQTGNIRKILQNKGKTTFPKTASEMGIWFVEFVGLPFVKQWKDALPQTYEDIGRALHGIRELNNTPVMTMTSAHHRGTKYYTIEELRPFYSIIMANGILLYTHAPTSLDINDNCFNLLSQYNRFCARYGEYLYDLDFHWHTADWIKVDGPSSLYWKDTIFEKYYPDNSIIVVLNILNLPENRKVWGEIHSLPEEVKNVKVIINTPENIKLLESWWASPDGQEEPLPLLIEKDNKEGTFIKIPFVKSWSMVILKLKK